MVLIHIPETKEKLRPLFPEDPRSDIVIMHKGKSYLLRKVFLRLHSNYFKSSIGFNTESLEISKNFN